MALIKCPECGKEISDKAIACPECGCPMNDQKPVVVRKDYKARAKAFTIAGIIVFLLTGVVAIANSSKMSGLKARYVMGNGGMYPVYSFVENLFTWVGIGLFIIGIIYWIINAANK